MHTAFFFIITVCKDMVYCAVSGHVLLHRLTAYRRVCRVVLHCILHSDTQTDEHGSAATEKAASTYFWEMEGALSLDEEVSKDIVVITCLAAELFLYKHVKTALCNGMALSQRVNLIRTLTESGRVRVP